MSYYLLCLPVIGYESNENLATLLKDLEALEDKDENVYRAIAEICAEQRTREYALDESHGNI